MTKSLMALLDERNQVVEQIETAENPAEMIESLDKAIQVKAAGIGIYCEKLDGMVAALDDTIKKLQARKKAFQNRKESLKAYTLEAMKQHGIEKIECPECTISIQKNPYKVEVEDERLIPREFWIIPPPPQPRIDKEKIKEAYLKDGEIVQGTKVIQTEGVRIR